MSAGPIERVIVSGDAVRELAGQRCPGVLALAERHLVFTPTRQPNVDASRFALSVPYEEVTEIRPLDALWIFPQGLSVICEGSPDPIRFHVQGRDQWREMIAGVRSDALTGAGPEALLARIESTLRPGPVDRVVSWPAIAAWITAPFAFIPILGLLPAAALVVFAGNLLAQGRRAHDRRAGVASIALGAAALICWGVSLASAMAYGTMPQDFPAAASETTLLAKAIQIAVLVLSVVLHECGHGLAAYWAGDATARRAGRLTLNPIRHVDPIGSVVLPAILVLTNATFIFGWAKPVPVNPNAFRRKTLGDLAVSLAGVSANLLIAMASFSLLAVLGAALHFAAPGVSSQSFWTPGATTQISGVPLAPAFALAADVLKMAALVNMVLFAFNLLPIPPLDGSHVLEKLLPRSIAALYAKLRPFGFIILVVCLTAGVLDFWYVPMRVVLVVLSLVVGAITGLG